MNKYQLTFGSDPEFFIQQDNICYPPMLLQLEHDIKPIGKYCKPKSDFVHYIYKSEDGINLEDDGAAFELTVPPVDLNEPHKLYDYIQQGYSWAKEIIEQFGLEFYPRPTIKFNLNKFNPKFLDELYGATIFGCDADYDAYDMEFKAKTFSAFEYPYRHAGGHFVVGTQNTDLLNNFHENILPFVKLLSMTVGAIALIKSPYLEEEKIRQNYYGKPGKHRTPKYGVEYRSPSVSWTMNKELYEAMFQSAEKAVELFCNPQVAAPFIHRHEVEFFDAYSNLNINTLAEIYNLAMNL